VNASTKKLSENENYPQNINKKIFRKQNKHVSTIMLFWLNQLLNFRVNRIMQLMYSAAKSWASHSLQAAPVTFN